MKRLNLAGPVAIALVAGGTSFLAHSQSVIINDKGVTIKGSSEKEVVIKTPEEKRPVPKNDSTVAITGSGKVLSVTCNGGNVSVSGSGHILTVIDACSAVSVSGNGHTVYVMSADQINVSGNSNTVRYQVRPGLPTKVSQAGNANFVTRVE